MWNVWLLLCCCALHWSTTETCKPKVRYRIPSNAYFTADSRKTSVRVSYSVSAVDTKCDHRVKYRQTAGKSSGSLFYEGTTRNSFRFYVDGHTGPTHSFKVVVTVNRCSAKSPYVDNGDVDCYPKNNENIHGATCYYTCDEGYRRKGDYSVSCKGTSWDPSPTPECTQKRKTAKNGISCSRYGLPTVRNGYWSCEGRKYYDDCHLSCKEGYRGSAHTWCKATGSWSDTLTKSCSIRYCSLLSRPANGSWSCPSGTAYGATCHLVCHRGYSGYKSTTCQGQGSWSSDGGVCSGSSSLENYLRTMEAMEESVMVLLEQPDQVFTVNINGQTYSPDVEKMDSSGQYFCPSGTGERNGFCVDCPLGNYGRQGRCALCPLGQYQDKMGMTHCQNCPPGTSWHTPGASSIAQCLNQNPDDQAVNPSSVESPGFAVAIGAIAVFMVVVFGLTIFCYKRTRQ